MKKKSSCCVPKNLPTGMKNLSEPDERECHREGRKKERDLRAKVVPSRLFRTFRRCESNQDFRATDTQKPGNLLLVFALALLILSLQGDSQRVTNQVNPEEGGELENEGMGGEEEKGGRGGGREGEGKGGGGFYKAKEKAKEEKWKEEKKKNKKMRKKKKQKKQKKEKNKKEEEEKKKE
ncbi:protein PXR1-like [Belonocnema kinseyi]|uniref:protein PXR1-like n=1 Tax=Belonocnema kinseyi TaxID=2817044 RepID=UPI00143D29B7|nr:protein PXR1-like [Belonocnema kinseyi]